jgi:Ca-activated chloride channel homolog
MKNVFKIITLALCFIIEGYSHAQSLRNLVNDGVDKYKNKKFTDSEVDFKKGLEKAPDNFQAKFNLGDAQYKQQRYDEAIKSYQQALKFVNDKDLKAKVYHNIGNSLLKSQKYKESVDAYINALKMNSKDEETKYNLSYALNMLKQQQENKQQNKNNKQDNKQDKNKDKQDQNKQDQNKNDKNQQNQNQNKDQQAQQDNTKQQDKQDQQSKQDKNKMSKEEAQRILNALKNNEQDLQKKLRKFEGKRVTVSKDW